MDKFMNFENYISARGVLITKDETFEPRLEMGILTYIKGMGIFHEAAAGFDNYMIKRLPNKTGQMVSNYKIMYRKFQREFIRMSQEGAKNKCDEFILDHGDEIIHRSSTALGIIEEEMYFRLLRRSMDRVEICIGNYQLDNLIMKDKLHVRDISQCNYDMIESDFIKLLIKLKRKHVKVNIEDEIVNFIEIEELNEDSEAYIKGCISYPYEFMRNSWRYFYGKREWEPQRYMKKLQRAVDQDGKSLI